MQPSATTMPPRRGRLASGFHVSRPRPPPKHMGPALHFNPFAWHEGGKGGVVVGRRGDGQTGGTLIMQHMFIQRLAVRVRGSPRCPAVNAREREGETRTPFFPSPYAAASGQGKKKETYLIDGSNSLPRAPSSFFLVLVRLTWLCVSRFRCMRLPFLLVSL